MLEIVRAHPDVEAACVQLQWMGMLTTDRRAHALGDPMYGDLALVRLVGIDVEDEFAATGFRQALANDLLSSDADRVADVDDPFAPPPGYRPTSRPLPGVLIGEQLALLWGIERGDEVERRDRLRIASLSEGDAAGFWRDVQADGDALRWCGSSPLYTFLRAVPARAELLRYEQWNIDEGSVVSFAGLAFRNARGDLGRS